jgi:hypothetical protein
MHFARVWLRITQITPQFAARDFLFRVAQELRRVRGLDMCQGNNQ